MPKKTFNGNGTHFYVDHNINQFEWKSLHIYKYKNKYLIKFKTSLYTTRNS